VYLSNSSKINSGANICKSSSKGALQSCRFLAEWKRGYLHLLQDPF